MTAMKRFEYTGAMCDVCGKLVEPKAAIPAMWNDREGRRYVLLESPVYVYWHCDNCGSVPARMKDGSVLPIPPATWPREK